MKIVVAILAVVLALPGSDGRPDRATVSAITANTAVGQASANRGSASERRVSAPTGTMRPVAPRGRRAFFRDVTSRGGEQILVGLYQSSQPKVASGPLLREAGIDVVVDMNSSSPLRSIGGPGGGVRYFSYPVRDDRPTKEEWKTINVAADLVASYVRQGKSVLVNCAVGRNRSATVNALALVRLGHSPEDAIRLVRRKTSPNSIRNPYFERGILTGNPWG